MGSPQIRNSATIGGNIVNAGSAADAVPCVISLGGILVIESVNGTRQVSCEGYFKNYSQEKINEKEILKKIILPKKNEKSGYYKLGKRNSLAIARVSAAVSLSVKEDRVKNIALCLGAVGRYPFRAAEFEKCAAGRDFEWLSSEEMEFSYRTSILQKKRKGVIVEATFQLSNGNRMEIVAEMQKNKDYRKVTQPWNFPCAGSIFRNPLPNYAGKLIEDAGLKGFSIGGAMISEMHGNFIVNAGNAKAEDVHALIQYVKESIYRLYQIKMETEVEIIGRK
jgi:hypothetical protein